MRRELALEAPRHLRRLTTYADPPVYGTAATWCGLEFDQLSRDEREMLLSLDRYLRALEFKVDEFLVCDTCVNKLLTFLIDKVPRQEASDWAEQPTIIGCLGCGVPVGGIHESAHCPYSRRSPHPDGVHILLDRVIPSDTEQT